MPHVILKWQTRPQKVAADGGSRVVLLQHNYFPVPPFQFRLEIGPQPQPAANALKSEFSIISAGTELQHSGNFNIFVGAVHKLWNAHQTLIIQIDQPQQAGIQQIRDRVQGEKESIVLIQGFPVSRKVAEEIRKPGF